jgi:DNA polymerase I
LKNPSVLLVDSNALIHRAYHAFPPTLSTSDGIQTNAVYGFFSILFQSIIKYNPDKLYLAFDSKEKTFRHKIYPAYKATRKKTDDELIKQFKIIKKILTKSNLNYIEIPGLEADDIIGTLSKHKDLKGKYKLVLTGDGDLLQLIDDETHVVLSGGAFQKSVLYDVKTAEEKLGYRVDQITDFKGLRGDSSDNIPGVKGIGEVTAKKLLNQFENLEEVISNLDKLDLKTSNKIQEQMDQAIMSKDIATIVTNEPITISLKNHEPRHIDFDTLVKEMQDMEFRSLQGKVDNIRARFVTKAVAPKTSQMGLLNVDIQRVKPKGFGEISEQRYTSMLNKSNHVIISDFYSEEDSCTKFVVLINGSSIIETDCDIEEYKFVLNQITKSKKSLIVLNSKSINKINIENNIVSPKIDFDINLAGYLLSGGEANKSIEKLFSYFNIKEEESNLLRINSLYLELKKRIELESKEIKELYYEVELPLSKVLAHMEVAGITLDQQFLSDFESKLDKKIKQVEDKIYQEVGEEFNINSPKQLGEKLFEKLKIPAVTKNKSGGFSTNERVLSKLSKSYPIIKNVLNYRELAKLKSTYTSALAKQVNTDTGRIHSTFNQDVTVTGRLSSTNPNLQNIPVSTDLGQEIRRAFVSAKGKKFLLFDYSQQELRLLAHLSEEKNLIEAFNQNIDIHALTASRILKKDIKEITKTERRAGKTINFGIVYGISAFGLSERLEIDTKVGQAYIDSFFLTYPKVKTYFNNLLSDAKKNGFVTTIMGRKKFTDGLKSPIFNVRRGTEREIINFPLQGSAADMIKFAMVKTQTLIDEEFSDFATMVLQIHDELIFEVNDKDLEKTKLFVEKISKRMLEIFELKVNMKVDVEEGYNLADTHSFN